MPQDVESEAGERMLWVHDIPEIRTGDLLVVETVENPQLAVDKEALETETARQLLHPIDYELFLRFNKAGNFWKGSGTADRTALGVKLVDILDGNIVFHERISEFCKWAGFDVLHPRVDASFKYAFDQRKTLLQQMELVPGSKDWLINLIKLQFAFIFNAWRDVEASNIPPVLREEFSKFDAKV